MGKKDQTGPGRRIEDLSAGAIAAKLEAAKPSKQPERRLRQVKYWANERLFEVGSLNPGTGTHRQFTPEAVFEAALLEELAKLGISLVNLKMLIQVVRNEDRKRRLKKRDGYSPIWRAARGEHSTILLRFGMLPDGESMNVALDEPDERLDKCVTVVTVDLTRLFADLA